MLTTDRITTPFTATSTATEVAEGIDLAGKRAVVTGASSGIGIETARVLALAGAEVTLAVRNTSAGEKVAAEINRATGAHRVRVAELELAHLASVRAFAALWGHTPLHLLVNNAGIMATPLGRTPAGWEQQFATNHLGHFALTTALRPALAAAGGARIVSLSLARAPALAGGLRRHQLRAPRVRPVAGLRPVQDRQHPVRRRGHQPVGRRRASTPTPCTPAGSSPT